MIVIAGIKNCDSCRKALKFIKELGLEHRFHDLRRDGLDAPTLARWCEQAGWESILNRRGTTWRQLAAEKKDNLDEARARALMLENPTLIKRPVVERAGEVVVGFGPDVEAWLQSR